MTAGRLFGSDTDGEGSSELATNDTQGRGPYSLTQLRPRSTFLIGDGGKGDLLLTCPEGGSIHFDFSFGHTSSSITVRRGDDGNGSVHFTEDPGNVVSAAAGMEYESL